MKSKDVTALYDQLPVGALVQVVDGRLPNVRKAKAPKMIVAKPEEKPADWVSSASKAKPVSSSHKNLAVAQSHPRA
jgi:hypothetical protein